MIALKVRVNKNYPTRPMAENDSKEAIAAKFVVYSNGDEEYLSFISKETQLVK
jgi:hypothetical protein